MKPTLKFVNGMRLRDFKRNVEKKVSVWCQWWISWWVFWLTRSRQRWKQLQQEKGEN